MEDVDIKDNIDEIFEIDENDIIGEKESILEDLTYESQATDVGKTILNHPLSEKLPQPAELKKRLGTNKDPLILSIDEIVERAIQNNNKRLEEVAIPFPIKLPKLKPIATNFKRLPTLKSNLKPISTKLLQIAPKSTNLDPISTNLDPISTNSTNFQPMSTNMKSISDNTTNLDQMSTNVKPISTNLINVKPISVLLAQSTAQPTSSTTVIGPEESADLKEFKRKQKELVNCIIKKKNAKIKTVSQENRLLRMKIEKMIDTIEILEKEKEDLKDFSFPEGMELHVQNLYKQLLKPKERYIPAEVKRFAVELSTISLEAYEYVRDSLGDNLPHNRTLQKWRNKRVKKKPLPHVFEEEPDEEPFESTQYLEEDMSEDEAS